MEEVAKKKFGRVATMWHSEHGVVTQTELGKIIQQAMKDSLTITVGNVTYTKASNGN